MLVKSNPAINNDGYMKYLVHNSKPIETNISLLHPGMAFVDYGARAYNASSPSLIWLIGPVLSSGHTIHIVDRSCRPMVDLL